MRVAGKAQNGRDGLGGAGQGDGVGLMRGEPFVAGVFCSVAVQDDFARQDFFQAAEQF